MQELTLDPEVISELHVVGGIVIVPPGDFVIVWKGLTTFLRTNGFEPLAFHTALRASQPRAMEVAKQVLVAAKEKFGNGMELGAYMDTGNARFFRFCFGRMVGVCGTMSVSRVQISL
jgi:hypothetical protein